MLNILPQQIVALQASAIKEFGQQVIAEIRVSSPLSIFALSEREIDERLNIGVSHCLTFNCQTKRDIRAMIRLCFVIGPNFVQGPGFQAQLEDRRKSVHERLTQLLRTASAEDWAIAVSRDIVARYRDGCVQHSFMGSGALSLQPLGQGHAEDYFRLSSHPDVYRLGSLKPFKSLKATQDFLSGGQLKSDETSFALEAEGLGFIGMLSMQRIESLARLHYWIGRPYWGQGWATKALRGVQTSVSLSGGVSFWVTSIHGENLPSLAVAAKAGFSLHKRDDALNLHHLKCPVYAR